VTTPSAEEQLSFLQNIQRLLDEGSFVATYKFALLSALADLSVERGTDADNELAIPTRDIAEKFILYYWRQSRPLTRKGQQPFVLRQNTGKEAGIIRLLREQLDAGFNSINQLKRSSAWKGVSGNVHRIVCEMPLWKLQTLGSSSVEFLYSNTLERDSITLKRGVMFGFRTFHTFITDMVRGAWIRYVRRFNQDMLGDPADLDEFLFGTERLPLTVFVPILRAAQSGECFYCSRRIRSVENHVDHFVPWATYPMNLAHNFVLADSACNTAKSDHLASVDHLERWISRNKDLGPQLSKEFDRVAATHNVGASLTIAQWAYNRAAASGAETFRERGVFEKLPSDWRERIKWAA
jgi:5-methylcytosine-specific restriction endonuclease McrA